jgi:hypothetical protein
VNLTPFLLRTRRPSLQTFVFPLAIAVKTAAIQAEFRESPLLRNFSLADADGLYDWAPEALVLPLGTALTIADRKLRDLFELPSLSTAIVARDTGRCASSRPAVAGIRGAGVRAAHRLVGPCGGARVRGA